jgi:hypothetical protein
MPGFRKLPDDTVNEIDLIDSEKEILDILNARICHLKFTGRAMLRPYSRIGRVVRSFHVTARRHDKAFKEVMFIHGQNSDLIYEYFADHFKNFKSEKQILQDQAEARRKRR